MNSISRLVASTVAISTLFFSGSVSILTPEINENTNILIIEPDEELFDHMLEIKANLRKLFKSAGSAENRPESLEYIAAIQKHVLAAKLFVPESIELLPKGKQEEATMQFRSAMAAVLKELATIEMDLIANRNEEAVKRIREDIVKMRNDAHEKYQIDD